MSRAVNENGEIEGVDYLDEHGNIIKPGSEGPVRGSHIEFSRAPYVLYGVRYIDLVALTMPASDSHLDFSRAPYGVYGGTYIDLV